MAQMARNYHDFIQTRDLPDEYRRMMATELVLEKCNVCLSENEFNEMDRLLTNEDIQSALRLSNNGKAPGIDGIPYEFLKTLDILFEESKESVNGKFDILSFLTKLYSDIETYGIAAGTNF
ncbi:hypothetical protein B0H14DRAFT_2164447, partial [Mycena olivaceomarginata]